MAVPLPTAALTNYGLPPLPPLPCPEFKGPTPWSNWVIKGRLLAGAYPASLDDAETDRILSTLLELGVNTFVCLQAEFSLHTPESAWRAGQGLRPYIKDAQKLLIRARETQSPRIKQDKLDFLHLPIIDGNVTSDSALSRLADDCCMRILRSERMYIHCWGGHGRTGTLVAVMLGRLYGVTCTAALRFTQAFHDSRKFPQGVRSPQTQPQVAQVKRLLPDPPSVRKVAYPRDPSIVLDDTILRPSSPAPSSPTRMPLVAAGAAAAGVVVEEMEVDASAQVLPTAPVNQQRKDAIRAAKQASSGGASAGAAAAVVAPAALAVEPAVPATPADITAALSAVSLQPKAAGAAAPTVAALGPPRTASPPPTCGRRSAHGWLHAFFDRDPSDRAQSPAGGNATGSAGAQMCGMQGAPAPGLTYGSSVAGAQQAQHGYLQSYVQQHQRMAEAEHAAAAAARPASISTASKAGSGGSGATVFLNASSTAGDKVAQLFTGAGDVQSVDMRPSRVTVGVPGVGKAGVPEEGPEQSGSSMARLRNYLSGGRASPTLR